MNEPSMIDAVALWQIGLGLAAFVPMGILKVLIDAYPRRSDLLYRSLIGGGEILCVASANVLMLLYIEHVVPESSGLVGSVICVLGSALVGIFVHIMNLMGEKKRRLTEQQKAELMDL